ncbi:MAG: NAD-dependent epimerase/dehydratase family protein [Xanthobacteraceae bacterium]|jgi:UDP-glucose 4-epimerase
MAAFLVTGGCGFIGQSLVAHLLSNNAHCVRVVDNLSAGRWENLERLAEIERVSGPDIPLPQRRIQLVLGDIRDAELAVAACRDVDAIVHLAANTGVAPSVADPRTDCTTNVVGTFNYLEGARKTGVRRFVFASSGATVGECEPPIHEELPSHPVSPYGASKLAGEAYCSAYARTFGISTVALRFGNVYGPGSEHKESVVAKFIRRAFAKQPLQIFGDGAQTRDFIFIDDLIKAIKLATAVDDVGGEVFQIATARETSVSELATALSDALEAEGYPRPQIEFKDRRAGDVLRNFADTRKAKARLNWCAETSLQDGLQRTVRWFVAAKGLLPVA